MTTLTAAQVGLSIAQADVLVMQQCSACHVWFAMPKSLETKARNDSRVNFYCPNGHCMHYSQEKEERERLQQALDKAEADAARAKRYAEAANADRDYFKRSRDAMKGQVTRLKNRAANGMCPCCNRHFTNLERHMTTKHPDYRNEEVEE